MRAVSIPFTTDGSGNFSTTIGKPTDLMLLYSIHIAGANLTGGTLLIQLQNTLSGFTRTLLNLASPNANAVYPPRISETNTSGAAQSTTTMMVLDGDVVVTISGAGATKTGTIVLFLIG